ncbi:MAG: NAD(P)H-hydrate dehydratase [Gammaproteobacteria bacterium]|nr:NAD(P)H-hydrate dehydratase [Gammaproteobacteria bacterium]
MPRALYTVAAIRATEQAATTLADIPSLHLMQRAGTAAFRLLRARWPTLRKVAVFCGPGNNGGDGYVLAREAHQAGLQVEVVQVGTPAARGDARVCFEALRACGGSINVASDAVTEPEVIVDALFGIGLNKNIEGDARVAIAAINHRRVPTLCLDLPSGLHADTGNVLGIAVNGTVTLTFIALKQGLVTGRALNYVGSLECADLGIPHKVLELHPPAAWQITWNETRARFAPRARAAHKGSFGHVLVVGGAPGFSGAARLAAEAALRSGAGLVSVAVHPEVAAHLNEGRPELMVHAVGEPHELTALLNRASVIAVGPGLGQGEWGAALFAAVREHATPLVVDADALNLLALDPQTRTDWVLTPHPGEAARLLKLRTAADIEAGRYRAALALQARYGGTAVLKGAGTLVRGATTHVISGGNPGMATGGMGDVLTGIIAGLLAQGLSGEFAAVAGAALHAAAADCAARDGERGLLASDLMPHLRTLVN